MKVALRHMITGFMCIENITSSKYYHAGGSSKRSLVQLPQLDRMITLGFEVDF